MFVIQGWVIEFVFMLLMPCKLSYNAAHFFSHSQLALPWGHFEANDSYMQSKLPALRFYGDPFLANSTLY